MIAGEVTLGDLRHVVIKQSKSEGDVQREYAIFMKLAELAKGGATGCVTAYDCPDPEYIVLELFGRDIVNLLHPHNGDVRYALCREIAAALRALHKLGFTHGDLKPQNILHMSVDGKRTVKLCDLECARSVRDGGELYAHDGKGELIRTAYYAPPEVIDGIGGQLKAATQSDNFSMGLVFVQIIDGTDIPVLEGMDGKVLSLPKTDNNAWRAKLQLNHMGYMQPTIHSLCSVDMRKRGTAAAVHDALLRNAHTTVAREKEQLRRIMNSCGGSEASAESVAEINATVQRVECMLKQQQQAAAAAAAAQSGGGLTLEGLRAELLGAISASTDQTAAGVASFVEVMKAQLESEFESMRLQMQSASAADQQIAMRNLLEMLVSKLDVMNSTIAEMHQEAKAGSGAAMATSRTGSS